MSQIFKISFDFLQLLIYLSLGVCECADRHTVQFWQVLSLLATRAVPDIVSWLMLPVDSSPQDCHQHQLKFYSSVCTIDCFSIVYFHEIQHSSFHEFIVLYILQSGVLLIDLSLLAIFDHPLCHLFLVIVFEDFLVIEFSMPEVLLLYLQSFLLTTDNSVKLSMWFNPFLDLFLLLFLLPNLIKIRYVSEIFLPHEGQPLTTFRIFPNLSDEAHLGFLLILLTHISSGA